MSELVINIPEELCLQMNEFPGVNWQLVVRRMLKNEIARVNEIKKIISKSKLTRRDVKELSEKIDIALSERFMSSSKK